MINEVDCKIAEVFGQDLAIFETSLSEIANERKLKKLEELFNHIQNDNELPISLSNN